MNLETDIQGYLLDKDGCLTTKTPEGKTILLDGAEELIRKLVEEKKPWGILTNNASRRPAEYANAMNTLVYGQREGPVLESQIITPNHVMPQVVEQLRDQGHLTDNRKVLRLGGGTGVDDALTNLELDYDGAHTWQAKEVGAVLIGDGVPMDHEMLEKAVNAVHFGVPLIIMNSDPVDKVVDGYALGTGTFAAAVLANVSHEFHPVWLGKEAKEIYEVARGVLFEEKVDMRNVVGIGDRFATDIYGARNAGAKAIFVNAQSSADKVGNIPGYLSRAVDRAKMLRPEEWKAEPAEVMFREGLAAEKYLEQFGLTLATYRRMIATERAKYIPDVVVTTLKEVAQSKVLPKFEYAGTH